MEGGEEEGEGGGTVREGERERETDGECIVCGIGS